MEGEEVKNSIEANNESSKKENPEKISQPDWQKNKKALAAIAITTSLLIIVMGIAVALKRSGTERMSQREDPSVSNDARIMAENEKKMAATPSPQAADNTQQTDTSLGDPNSSDPLTKGKALSNGQCTGTGSKKLTAMPMDLKDIGTILPYGGMIYDHVTPIDHQYYYQTNQKAAKNTYPVYAPADGTIVEVGHVVSGNSERWRIVITYSCTFFSYYDLLTDFEKSLKDQLPAAWGPNNNGGVKIPVKGGQIVGYVGGQSLDFAVWDTTSSLKKLLHPTAYNNREPWKINTVPPLNYFSEEVKTNLLTRYVRTAEPRDGTLDYDIDGQAVGTWFVEGSNGYAGGTSGDGTTAEYASHLSLAYDYIDPSAQVFSIGAYKGSPAQFAVKGNAPDWKSVTPSSGQVKVELAQLQYKKKDGSLWTGDFAQGITANAGSTLATALLEMTENQKMKVEVFPGKTPSQVSGFTAAAKIYNRGQDATMIQSTTAH